MRGVKSNRKSDYYN